MNDQPKVSIITVCFNSAKTIRDTIESVINQTYQNIEYIIIDGGSTDSTVDIIKEYQPYIAKWVSEPDEGIYDAMNKGIKMATGEIIGILNSDDWYSDEVIEKIVRLYESCKESVVIHGNICRVTADKQPLYKDCGSLLVSKENMYNISLKHPSCFVVRDIYLNKGAFDKSFRISGDTELLYRFIINEVKFLYLDEVVAFMREGGVSQTHFFTSLKENFNIRKRYNVSLGQNVMMLIHTFFLSGTATLLCRLDMSFFLFLRNIKRKIFKQQP